MPLACSAEPSKTTAESIASYQIQEEPSFHEEPSTAVSDAAVTIGGVTEGGQVDEPHPIDPELEDRSYTTALQLATGVEEVEGASASFMTAEDEAAASNENEMGKAEASQSEVCQEAASADVGNAGEPPVEETPPPETVAEAEVPDQYHEVQEAAEEEMYASAGASNTGMDTTSNTVMDTTGTVGAQSLAFLNGAGRYTHRPEARFVPDVRLLRFCFGAVTCMHRCLVCDA
jgi:hypothetical protein